MFGFRGRRIDRAYLIDHISDFGQRFIYAVQLAKKVFQRPTRSGCSYGHYCYRNVNKSLYPKLILFD
jgi:hypothetical protein